MSAITTTVRRWPNGTTMTEFRGPDPVTVLAEAQSLHDKLDPWLRGGFANTKHVSRVAE